MLDYLRNLRKSDEEKRQERLTAYLDNALTPRQRQQVEQDLAQDQELFAEVEQMRLLQQAMRQLPQRRVKRNFTLDPSLYGRPQREPLVQAYPVLRTATVIAAFLFIFLLAANVFMSSVGMVASPEPIAMQMASDEEAAAGEPAEAPLLMEAAPAEEEVEAPAVAEEVQVEPEFAAPADEAEQLFQELAQEAEEAVTMEEAPAMEIGEAETAAEEKALTLVPTRVVEGTAVAEDAVEQDMVATAIANEQVEIPEMEAPAPSRDMAEDAAPAPETDIPASGQPTTTFSLVWLTLVLGVVFILLVLLTLLARRRL